MAGRPPRTIWNTSTAGNAAAASSGIFSTVAWKKSLRELKPVTRARDLPSTSTRTVWSGSFSSCSTVGGVVRTGSGESAIPALETIIRTAAELGGAEGDEGDEPAKTTVVFEIRDGRKHAQPEPSSG